MRADKARLRRRMLDLLNADTDRRERAACSRAFENMRGLGPQVAAVVAEPDFPRRDFYRTAAEMIILAQKRWVFDLKPPPGAESPSLTLDPSTTSDPHRRAGIEWCLQMDAELQRNPPTVAEISYGGITLWNVLEYAVDAALEAPEAVWALLHTPGCDSVGAETLANAGTRAAPLFLPELLHYFADRGYVNYPQVLSAVGRGDARVIDAALAQLAGVDEQSGDAWSWPHVLSGMGRAAATPEVLKLLHEWETSPARVRRAIVAMVLPRIAPDDPATAQILLRLLHDEDVGEEDSVLPMAVSGAEHLPKFADVLTPRLVELLPVYEEPNPDYSYGGRAARVCGALQAMGPSAAQAAVPALRPMLRQAAAEKNVFLAASMIHLLSLAGDAARDALPELRALAKLKRDQDAAARQALQRLLRKLEPRTKRRR